MGSLSGYLNNNMHKEIKSNTIKIHLWILRFFFQKPGWKGIFNTFTISFLTQKDTQQTSKYRDIFKRNFFCAKSPGRFISVDSIKSRHSCWILGFLWACFSSYRCFINLVIKCLQEKKVISRNTENLIIQPCATYILHSCSQQNIQKN